MSKLNFFSWPVFIKYKPKRFWYVYKFAITQLQVERNQIISPLNPSSSSLYSIPSYSHIEYNNYLLPEWILNWLENSLDAEDYEIETINSNIDMIVDMVKLPKSKCVQSIRFRKKEDFIAFNLSIGPSQVFPLK